jgi:hypothetical protein
MSLSSPDGPVDRLRVRDFEHQLDLALNALPSVSKSGDGAISLSAKIIEEAYVLKRYGIVEHLKTGLEVLAPLYIQRNNSEEPDIEELTLDLIFAGHYYCLRNYLYYTYNAPALVSALPALNSAAEPRE